MEGARESRGGRGSRHRQGRREGVEEEEGARESERERESERDGEGLDKHGSIPGARLGSVLLVSFLLEKPVFTV